MTPIEIAKQALERIVLQDLHDHVGAKTLAINALTEIAIEEANARPAPSPATLAAAKRLFGRHH